MASAVLERPSTARRERVERPPARAPRTMAIVPEWIEAHCIVPDGFRAGRQFRLYDYQLLYLANFYLVRGDVEFDPVNPILAPAFVYRRAMLVGPQGLGKNPMVAAQTCNEAVGPALFAGWAGRDDGYSCAAVGCGCGWEYGYEPGEPMGMAWAKPLIQITAVSEKSTENTYDALKAMVDDGPLAGVLRTGEDFIRVVNGGRIDTVTASALSRQGNGPTFVPQDELGLWRPDNKMDRVADTQYRNLGKTGGRASLTSNAWDPSERSVARVQASEAGVYVQFVQPPKSLSYGDRRERRRIHRIVYPADVLRENGGHVDLDSIENEAAGLVARGEEAQAARFYGNILVAGAGHAVAPRAWSDIAKPKVVVADGTRIGLGFDGSVSRDATILRACTAEGHRFTLGKWIRPANAAPDWIVPRAEVREAVADAFRRFDVARMLADPPRWWTELDEWAAEHGEEVVIAFDTFKPTRMAPVVGRWRESIAQGVGSHDGDRDIEAHVLAAHVRKVHLVDDDLDGRTGYLLVKGPELELIDGAIADALAYEAAMTMPAEDDPSVYIERGFREL